MAIFAYSEKKLARDLAKAASKLEPDLESDYNAERRSLYLYRASEPDAPPYAIFLGNLFLKVKSRSRGERRAILEDFVLQMLNPPELSKDEMLASLALRARTHFEVNLRRRLIELQHGEPPDFVMGVSGDLIYEIVSDRDEVVRSITHEDLAELETTADEALKIARARLAGATDEYQWQQVAENVWRSAYDDDYDFARLLADPGATRWPFDGKPVILAPSHSVCLTTDRTDPETLNTMIDIGCDAAAEHRGLSQRLWTLGDDCIVAWMTTEHDPAHPVRLIRDLAELMNQYNDQKGYLTELLDRRNEDAYVAEFSAYEKDGAYVSYVTYTINLPTYLAEADHVAIVGGLDDGKPDVLGYVLWREFEEALGPGALEAMPDLSPKRFQLTEPLSNEQVTRLKARVRSL